MNGKRDTEREDYVFDCFPRLKERLKQSGNTLSGGEQQMLAIARCLMMRPKLIILDEPTEGIMPLLVSTDSAGNSPDQPKRRFDPVGRAKHRDRLEALPTVFLMEKGVVVYSGTSEDLKTNAQIVHRYLGLSRKAATEEIDHGEKSIPTQFS